MENAVSEFTCTWHYKDWVEVIGVILLVIVYPGIEYWFGKTQKTRAGSALEFVLLLGKSIFRSKKQKLITGHVAETTEEDSEMAILEGKELEGKIGEVGSYELDINDKLVISGVVKLEFDLFAELEKLAKKSNNKIVAGAVAALGSFLGREATPEIPAPVETKV